MSVVDAHHGGGPIHRGASNASKRGGVPPGYADHRALPDQGETLRHRTRWTSPPNAAKCGEAYVVLQTTRSAPATIPASVQNGGGTVFYQYVQKTAIALPDYWVFPAYAEQVAIPECGPPASPPAG